MLDRMRIARPRWLAGLAVLVALPLGPCARAASAEDDPFGPGLPPPKKRPGDGGFRFAPPDDTAPPSSPTGPATPPTGPKGAKAPAGANDPVSLLIRQLATWPGQDGVKAAESLLLTGPDVVDPLLRALDKGDPSCRPGAAWVLGKAGSPVHVPAILRAAAERQSGNRLEVFFEAAYELDAALTKKWLFSFLTLDRPMFRQRATEFLAERVTPEDRPRIDGLVNAPARQGAVRIAGLELLSRLKATDAEDRLVDALGDPYPDVAKRATAILAEASSPALVLRLNRLVREADARQRAYATLAIVEVCRRERRNAFERETVTALAGRRGLLHPDRLPRAASAVGLGWGGADVPDPTIAGLLDSDVVSVLIETVGGDHFLDYNSLVEPIFVTLRRLSGLELSSSAKPWAQWWQENLGTFHARRTLSGVPDADLPHARIVFETLDAEGRRRRASFVAEGGDPVEDAYILPVAGFQALVGGLEDAGLFQEGDDQRVLTDEHLAVKVGVFNQERRLVVVPSKEDARYETLRGRMDALEEGSAWQRYRDADEFPDAGVWRKRQTELFSTAEADVRRVTLIHMIAFAFDDLPSDAARHEALDHLERLGANDLSDAEARHLLAWATSSKAFGSVEARVTQRLAALRRPELAEPLVEALTQSASPAAQEELAVILSDAGPLRIREGFADPRSAVRSAAAVAASRLLSGPLAKDETVRARLGAVFEQGLRALLVDPDSLVRVRAASSLAILGDATMLGKLQELYGDGDTTVRLAVAEGLGRIGGPSVQPLLVRIVGEVGPQAAPIRAAALEAMARTGNREFARILQFYMLNDADAGVQQAAEAALVSMASEEAQQVLVDALTNGTVEGPKRARLLRALGRFEGPAVRETLGRFLEDADVAVVNQAALGLARQTEGVAVPYLVQILKRPEEPLRPNALEALQELTSTTMLVQGYEANADQYEMWYRAHRKVGDRAWYRDALTRRGYDTTSLAGYAQGENDLKGVPILLKALRDEDPVIRRNADVALRRVSGVAFGRVERTTSREDASAVADRWADWWSRQPESSK